MLTAEAHAERKWGQFPVLRTVLESRRLPDSYFGPTGVSDNIFDQLHRTLEISLLACESEAEIRKAAQADGPNAIIDDLRRLEAQLHDASSRIDEISRRVAVLCKTL
jgi:hypothetical protein